MADKSFWGDRKDLEWFKNFIYYYKIHIAVIIFLIISVIYTVNTVINHADADISIDIYGGVYIEPESNDKFKEYLSYLINDIDGKNGKVVTTVQRLQSSLMGDNSEIEQALAQAIMVELSVGESYLYIVNDDYITDFENSGVLLDLSTIDPELGKGTLSLRIDDNKLLKNFASSVDEPLYLCVRDVTPSVSDNRLEKAQGMCENAKIIFKEFYKNR